MIQTARNIAQNEHSSQPYGIAGFRIEPELNRIKKGDELHQVEPKVMQVLNCLAARSGQVVSHEYLMATVWVDTVVDENALRRTISQLRKLFGDNPRRPQFIETIPKKGYRLIARMERLAAEPAVSPEPLRQPAKPEAKARASAWWVLIPALVVLLYWVNRSSREATTLTLPPDKIAVTSYPGLEINPVFSPDNSQIAFIRKQSFGDVGQLNVRLVEGGPSLALTDDNTQMAAWSPRGDQLAYVVFAGEQPGIYLSPALGGANSRIPNTESIRPFSVDWLPQGDLLVVSHGGAGAGAGLSLISPDGSQQQQLTNNEGTSLADRFPVVSPDGSNIVFSRFERFSHSDLYVIPSSGGTPRRLTHDRAHIPGYDWTPDGKSVVFSSNRDGRYRLWQLPIKNGTPRWLAQASAYDPGGVAIDGNGRLAYVDWFYQLNIWSASLTDADEEPKSIIASTRWDMFPSFSPDGQRVAFTSNRMGDNDLWVSNADGSQPLKLTSLKQGFAAAPAWSSDGKHLVFTRHETGNAAVSIIDALGGPYRDLTGLGNNDGPPSFAPNDEWVYYGARNGLDWQIHRLNRSGGDPVAVTTNGGFRARASGDRSTLYYSCFAKRGIWRKTLPDGPETQFLDETWVTDWGNWDLVGDQLFFIKRPNGKPHVFRKPLDGGPSQDLGPLQGSLFFGRPTVSFHPNGKTVLYTLIDQLDSDINMVNGLFQ